MSDFYLKTPDITMLDDIAAFRQEFLDNGDRINGSSNLQDYSNPKKWLDYLEFEKRRSTDFKDFPESFQCVYVNGDTGLIVGMIQYRNDYVKKINKYLGNIGYCVRPRERRKGHAKKMLSDMLIKCSEAGIKDVSIICNVVNEGSRKVILANGGIFKSIQKSDVNGALMETYQIKLSD